MLNLPATDLISVGCKITVGDQLTRVFVCHHSTIGQRHQTPTAVYFLMQYCIFYFDIFDKKSICVAVHGCFSDCP